LHISNYCFSHWFLIYENRTDTEGVDMTDAGQFQQQAALSLERLWPRLEIIFRDEANADTLK
jgi:hypothetical protein